MSKLVLGSLLALVLVASLSAEPQADVKAALDRKDYAAALAMIQPLAQKGEAWAQNTLGLMYFSGEGVPQDYVQAHKWYNLAASRFSAGEKIGRDKAIANRNRVAELMTPEQIAEAQKLASEWKPTPTPNH